MVLYTSYSGNLFMKLYENTFEMNLISSSYPTLKYTFYMLTRTAINKTKHKSRSSLVDGQPTTELPDHCYYHYNF